MFDLTPGERRGAAVLLALCLLAALWDLGHRDPVDVPAAVESAAAPAAVTAPVAGRPVGITAAGPGVDPGRASAEEASDALPGIGPVLASRIVEHRRTHGPYRSADELLAVPGIGPRLLERLRPYIRVGASHAATADSLQNATSPRN